MKSNVKRGARISVVLLVLFLVSFVLHQSLVLAFNIDEGFFFILSLIFGICLAFWLFHYFIIFVEKKFGFRK